MFKSPSKESNIPPLSHIGLSVEHHSSVVNSACDARQNSPRSISSRAPPLFPIGSSEEHHTSVVDSACDARQNSLRSITSRTGFLSAALPESSLQETSIDLQSALTLLLS